MRDVEFAMGYFMKTKKNPWLTVASFLLAAGMNSQAFLDGAVQDPRAVRDSDILRRFVVDTPHGPDYVTENALTQREFAPNSILTNGAIDPFFAKGGFLFAPTDKGKVKVYAIAIDFDDLVGDVQIPFGLQRNVLTSFNSVYDISDPDIHVTAVWHGSDGMKANNKFQWNGTPANEYKGLIQLLNEMAMGRCTFEVELLNKRAAADPANDRAPWFRVPGPMLQYAVQSPADCEDYRQFSRLHQAAVDAAYANIPDLDIEDIDFLFTIVPINAHGYRAGLQGGSGLDTSFSFNDQALLIRSSEYRHEPGVRTKGGRMIGSGTFGIKGLWNARDPNNAPRSSARINFHETAHGLGMFDDYAYGVMGPNPGEVPPSGVGQWQGMQSQTPDHMAWRKFRNGWINDDEVLVVMPGETREVYLRANGSFEGDGGSYKNDPSIKTRLIAIPKEVRTRDTFGTFWDNGWNPHKLAYNWFDWFTNPFVGGETHSIKTFPTFYTLESRKTLGADGNPKGLDAGLAPGNQGVVVSYVANPTWESGHGAGGFKVLTGNAGLRVGGTPSWADPHIGLAVEVLESGVYFDKIRVSYTGIPTSEAKHVYQAELKASDNFVVASQTFSVGFDIMTIGATANNDGPAISSDVVRVGTPLGVPAGISGFKMEVVFDAAILEYVSAGSAPFTYTVDTSGSRNGKLLVTGIGNKMVDKDTILSLNFRARPRVATGNYKVEGTISDVTLINWRGKAIKSGEPGFSGVGTFGDGTLSAIYNTVANNSLTSNLIKSTGGLVTIGNAPTHTLTGSIVCDTPGPAAGTFMGVESMVELYDRTDKKVAETKSKWDGSYVIKGVPSGTGYYIKASKPKYSLGKSPNFNVSAAARAPELKLARATYTITGKVLGSANSDGSGAIPLAGVEVYAVSIGSAYKVLGGPVKTDVDGAYTLEATTDSNDKPFGAVAVRVSGAAAEYGVHVRLKKDGLSLNLGRLYGIGPGDYVWPSDSQQYGVGGGYNFKINDDATLRTNRDIVLTKTQEVHIRTSVKSTEHVYQLRTMDGRPVGRPVSSLGNTNGDDILFNVPKGMYYIDVTRPGHAGMATQPFAVDTTRVFLRNGPATNTMDVRMARRFSGQVVDEAGGKPIGGARLQFVARDSAGGLGAPMHTNANGEFAYPIPTGVGCEVTISVPGYVARTIAIGPDDDISDMAIELRSL